MALENSGVKTKLYIGEISPANLVLERTDPLPLFQVGFSSSDEARAEFYRDGWNPDLLPFSIEYEGYFEGMKTGLQEFNFRSDRRSMLVIDDEVIFDYYTDPGGTGLDGRQFFKEIVEGQYYHVKIKYSTIVTGFPSSWVAMNFTYLEDTNILVPVPFVKSIPEWDDAEWFQAREEARWMRYKIFPWWIVSGTVGSEEQEESFLDSIGNETASGPRTLDRQIMTIQEARMTKNQHRFMRDFRRLHRGSAKPFLVRDIRRYEIGKMNRWTNQVIKKEVLGIGDGTNKEFQLRVQTEIQGDVINRNMLFIDHAYPDLYDQEGNLIWPTQWVRVWINGIESTFGWEVNRVRSGIIRFSTPPNPGAVIEAVGYAYSLMRFRSDSFPTSPEGSKFFNLEDSCELIEPRGLK